jgi:PleD family two-component response regulator
MTARVLIVDRAAGSVSITVSIGLAEWRENSNTDELYRRADRALYRSKSAGRNRITQDAAPLPTRRILASEAAVAASLRR